MLTLTLLTCSSDNLRDTPLSRLTEWEVSARCQDLCCPPGRLIPVQDIIAARGDLRLEQVLPTLRCAACGGPAAGLSLQRSMDGGTVSRSIQRRL